MALGGDGDFSLCDKRREDRAGARRQRSYAINPHPSAHTQAEQGQLTLSTAARPAVEARRGSLLFALRGPVGACTCLARSDYPFFEDVGKTPVLASITAVESGAVRGALRNLLYCIPYSQCRGSDIPKCVFSARAGGLSPGSPRAPRGKQTSAAFSLVDVFPSPPLE
jgi:hypothetical protein